ncbi:acyltransferase family protein [Hydrotalea sp.]|uniref:acyltransferase family protein n=1 Tax=Hydrotalea sp. TaxID=2881279 RepID=UPI003D0B2F28
MSTFLNKTDRLISLDVMRGLIMILLAGESATLYSSLQKLSIPYWLNNLNQQFFHHPWHGLHFWDLVQPAFMTIAGTAMYISYAQKLKLGISWQQNFKHILIRSLKLFLLGTGLHCVYAGKLVFELWNVLTQLAVTTIISYLFINASCFVQILVGILLIAVNDIAYHFIQIPFFNLPFVEGKNLGSYIDILLMGKINTDGWVAINCIPTAAHTLWGVTIGKYLMEKKNKKTALIPLISFAVAAIISGYLLNFIGLSLIIKRIATAAFVLVSFGWVLLILLILYWWVDIKNHKKYTWSIIPVGMNAIFIYLFFETVGYQWLRPTTFIFVGGFAQLMHISQPVSYFINALVVWFIYWYLCNWLYKKKIFIKL